MMGARGSSRAGQSDDGSALLLKHMQASPWHRSEQLGRALFVLFCDGILGLSVLWYANDAGESSNGVRAPARTPAEQLLNYGRKA